MRTDDRNFGTMMAFVTGRFIALLSQRRKAPAIMLGAGLQLRQMR
jgi:hypothetical protein